MDNKSPEELNLEQEFISGRINTPDEFSRRLKEVYGLVNGDYGREIFDNVILGALPVVHRGDLKAAGLEALALIAESSTKLSLGVPIFLGAWAVGKIKPDEGINPRCPNSIDELASELVQQQAAPEAHIPDIDYSKLPVLVYSDDNHLLGGRGLEARHTSYTANRKHMALFNRKLVSTVPYVKYLVGAERATVNRDTSIACYVGYCGDIDGQRFDMMEGSGPLVVSYSKLDDLRYKHASEDEFGVIYAVTSLGTKSIETDPKKLHLKQGPAQIAITLILPKPLYESFVGNQLRDLDELIRKVLPENPWHNYLDQGRFFSKPRIICEMQLF